MRESFLHYIEVERGLSHNTLAAYRRDIVKLEHYAEKKKKKVEQLGPNDIREFLRGLHRHGLSHRSIARTVSAIRGLYRFTVAEGRVHSDPTEQIDAAKIPRSLPRYLEKCR